jgi:hypothetical protein
MWLRETRIPLTRWSVPILAALFSIISADSALGQTASFVRRFGPAYPMGIAVSSGSVYVSGITDGTLPGKTGAGGTDAFVSKYNVSGNEPWTRQFGTAAAEFFCDVAADTTGVYAVGYTLGALPGQGNLGGSDAFIRKYDVSGSELWTRQFGRSFPTMHVVRRSILRVRTSGENLTTSLPALCGSMITTVISYGAR